MTPTEMLALANKILPSSEGGFQVPSLDPSITIAWHCLIDDEMSVDDATMAISKCVSVFYADLSTSHFGMWRLKPSWSVMHVHGAYRLQLSARYYRGHH